MEEREELVRDYNKLCLEYKHALQYLPTTIPDYLLPSFAKCDGGVHSKLFLKTQKGNN